VEENSGHPMPEIEKTQSQEEIKIKEQPLWANITGYHQLK
jgi:hypothetical protein